MITEIIAPEIERSQFSAPQGEPRDEEANNKTEIFGAKENSASAHGRVNIKRKIRSHRIKFVQRIVREG